VRRAAAWAARRRGPARAPWPPPSGPGGRGGGGAGAGGGPAIQAVTLRRACPADNARIAAIWNHEVMWTTATMDTEPRCPAAQRRWLATHDDAHPVVVAVDGDEVLAYGSLSPYCDRPSFASPVA